MAKERSVVEGFKRTVREDLCEDNPITSRVYQAGRYDGKVEGYEEASDEYESKLLKQADEFLKQQEIFDSERDAYEQLLDDYDAEINAFSEKLDRTEAENEYLQQLLLRDRESRKMAS
jgi:hypothetical protein